MIVKGTTIRYNNQPATILLLVDITERKQLETEREQNAQELKRYSLSLQQANRQVNLLSSITRHDILNQVNIGLLHIDNLKMEMINPELSTKLDDIESVIRTIQSQIEFTRIYENLGLFAPEWYNLDILISYLCPPKGIVMHYNLDNFMIYADKMIEKVFFNLLDNSIRHGGNVTKICLYTRITGKELLVIFEDDGRGIPPEEKELIFKRGYGKNTGFGMFLVREILSLTGISIRENGISGSGVRFEIHVPEGMFKKTNSDRRNDS
ncbi:MAG: hypothetical protein GXY48_00240 [Methanomicrobiales archaeon]|nr:hypothetical protein [Methanomicrobiales archaeon]